jgi:hypothetical protein
MPVPTDPDLSSPLAKSYPDGTRTRERCYTVGMTSRVQLRTFVTNILRNHFDTEASDAGLRSLDLASTGARGSASYDASAVARVDRGHGHDHRRVRATLTRLHSKHVEMLSLAYGTRLRSRDTEDSKKRKAIPRAERNWRVRLVELYGNDGAIVLASPLARKLFAEHAQVLRDGADATRPDIDERLAPLRSRDAWDVHTESAEELLARARNAVLPAESQDALDAAVKAAEGGLVAWLFDAGRMHMEQIGRDARARLNEALDAFAVAHGLEPEPATPRRRSSERTRIRILALHPEHGQVIGR